MAVLAAAVLIQITRADVQAMLRRDVISLVLGVLQVGLALLAGVLYLRMRPRREPSLAWFAAFALLYGLRLLARTGTFRVFFDLPAGFWEYVASTITYAITVPLLLFVATAFPGLRRAATRTAIGVGAFAVIGIAADLFLHRPGAAATPSNLIAIGLIVAGLQLSRRHAPRSRELRILKIGLGCFGLAAIVDNVRGIWGELWAGPNLEPLGFAVLLVCLGTVAAWRVLGNAERLVALDRELSIARRIQASILPSAMPAVAGLRVAARYRPMTAVAGDFYDFLELPGDRLGILVADVSGHGVPAALIASMVKVAIAGQRDRADHPAAVLAGMNETLWGRLGGQYVTAAYLYFDSPAGILRYAAAGHPPQLLLRGPAPSAGLWGRLPEPSIEPADRGHPAVRQPAAAEELMENGFPLGLMENAAYTQIERPLRAGDRVLLYTDGLVEAANAAEELFELDRVKQALAAGTSLSPDAFLDRLLAELDHWSGQPAGDDLTVVMIDRL